MNIQATFGAYIIQKSRNAVISILLGSDRKQQFQANHYFKVGVESGTITLG